MNSVTKYIKNQRFRDHLEDDRKEIKRLKAERKKNKPKQQKLKGFKKVQWATVLTYGDFLHSDYWNQVRVAVLKRDNYKCIICKTTENLQVHHNTYRHHFKEHLHLEDLDTLCRGCHKIYHEEINDKVK